MMTPLKKELDHTILRVERVSREQMGSDDNGGTSTNGGDNRHVAGGQHQGIIVNKQLSTNNGSGCFRRPFDLRLAFKVYLINAITQIHQQESRELRFWFSEEFINHYEQCRTDPLQCAQAFFRALVNPVEFPKNYVGFIMKLMKTMQQPIYRPLVQIELEVRQVDDSSLLSSSAMMFDHNIHQSSPISSSSSPTSSRPCKYFIDYSQPPNRTLVTEDNKDQPEGMNSNNNKDLLFNIDPSVRSVFEQKIQHQQIPNVLPDLVRSINNNKINKKNSRGPPPPIPPKPSKNRVVQQKQPSSCCIGLIVLIDSNCLQFVWLNCWLDTGFLYTNSPNFPMLYLHDHHHMLHIYFANSI